MLDRLEDFPTCINVVKVIWRSRLYFKW